MFYRIKKTIYKSNFLFYFLKKYWTFNYFLRIITNSENYFLLTKSQFNNEENEFISFLSKYINSKNFVEIGFHYREINCINLLRDNFSGTMVDANMGEKFNTEIMKFISKMTKRPTKIIKRFINLENIDDIFSMKKLGCLSIDIDGNEFWIISKILDNGLIPEVIVTEYNASFLNHEVSVPYDKEFNIHKKDKSLWYHGASLVAFDKLLNKFDYGLLKVIGGTNAIFAQNELIKKANLKSHSASDLYQECKSRNIKGKNSAIDQFNKIKNLPLIKV